MDFSKEMEEFDPFAADDLSFFQVFTSGAKDAEVTLDKRRREHVEVSDRRESFGGEESAKRVRADAVVEEKEEEEEEDDEAEQQQSALSALRNDFVLLHDSAVAASDSPSSSSSSLSIGRVSHSVAAPRGVQVTEAMRSPAYPPPAPARAYPFELDPFQKMSIAVLERSESVLVSAHTSAGKTVVAEYAIAMGLRDKQRVVYTSPLKALSNQKYRELDAIFGDVGLMTGDVTLNPSASCIVMTTEILRSMLYRGSELMREVGTVVFDEIHYMRDPERGVVWEETIILLPQKVKYVFLSATIPNAEEFAAWIACTHMQTCHVVYTDVRPVPLQHYLFPAGGAGLHLVVDDKGKFRQENFQKAIASVQSKATGGRTGATKEAGHSDIFKIVQMIMNKNYDPVIVFAFSKRDCEALAMQMGKLSFTSEDEKSLIRKIFANAIEPLSEDDKQLPQIQHLLPLLQKGIGIHHSGLLPLIKEVVEILFQEGLIKCLFATETFAMGLNMPAHTAVFSSVRKFDGKEMRWISGGEYVQMSGRAGRRGKDERGIVILMVDEKIDTDVAIGMLKGSTQPLISSFHITYSMLLNLMRVEGVKPEMLISSSFAAFQARQRAPALESALVEAQERARDTAKRLDEGGRGVEARLAFSLRARLDALRTQLEDAILQPVFALPFLQPGRLVRLDDGWAALVSVSRQGATRADCVLDVMMGSSNNTAGNAQRSCRLSEVRSLSSVRIPLPSDTAAAVKRIETVLTKFAPHGPPLLDPADDMGCGKEPAVARIVGQVAALEVELSSAQLQHVTSAELLMAAQEQELQQQAEKAREELDKARHAYLGPELKRMRRVLRRLQFTTEDDVIDTKGRVACEIQASDELLLVEMLFNGLFNNLSPPVVAALLSCFVFDPEKKSQGKSGETDAASQLPPALLKEMGPALRTMQTLARRVATVMLECKMDISPEEYVSKFSPALANVVFQWASGAKFVDICKLTSVFEGHITRGMRRLEEVLRQLMQASKAIGNDQLEQKFSAAITAIKRDVIFSLSLFL